MNTAIVSIKKLNKLCAVCGRQVGVSLYRNGKYRGGHYFGKIPLCSKKEIDKAIKSGCRNVNISGRQFQVLKKDPKPYRFVEYWECPKCYWNK